MSSHLNYELGSLPITMWVLIIVTGDIGFGWTIPKILNWTDPGNYHIVSK